MTNISPVGTEILVNTTTGQSQVQPQTTHLANGRFVTVWVDSTLGAQVTAANFAAADIKAQIFNADGTKFGSEFLVNTTTAGPQAFPLVTELSDGHILFTWQDGIGQLFGGPTAPASTMQGREFDASGVALGAQFNVGPALFASVAPLAGGGFVATWQAAPSTNVLAQIFDTSNAPVGSQIIVDSSGFFAGIPTVTTLANGNFVVYWNNGGAPGASVASLRIYSPSGTAVTGEILVDPGLPFQGQSGLIIALASGGFAIPIKITTPGAVELHFQLYFPDGTFGTDTLVATLPAGFDTSLSLTPLANGGLAATWTSGTVTGGDTDIHVQGFNGIGNPFGAELTVNTQTSGNQLSPTGTLLTNGDFVVSWVDNSGIGGDTSGSGIKSQIFHLNQTNDPPVAADDVYIADNGVVNSTDDLLNNDFDPDGDPLIVTDIFNVVGGTVTLDIASQTYVISRPAGYGGPVSFDYSISDGAGASDVGHATTTLSPNDMVTVRGGNFAVIDFLANDFLPARADGYAFSILGAAPGSTLLVGPANAPVLLYFPLSSPQGLTYLTLPVGQTLTNLFFYNVSNPVTSAVDYTGVITITLEGWTQTGGAAADNLVGGPLADHLIGGSGAANILTGGLGDDWYTVSVAGDQIVELPGGGTDRILSMLTSFTLPDNVEELQPFNVATLNGTGNALDNLLIGSTGADILSGLAGADQIVSGAGADILNGGAGNDRLDGGTELDTATYAGNSGSVYVDVGAGYALESAQTTGTYDPAAASLSRDALLQIENITGSNFGDRIYGTETDNVIAGGAGGDILYALGGSDTIDYGANSGAVFADLAASTTLETAMTAAGTVGAADAVISTDYLYSFENANGSAFGDRLYGTNAINILNGGAGDDILYGLQGNDTLNGGDGADRLIGGEGRDTMSGGAGADRFYFSTAPEPTTVPPGAWDLISDFVSGTDQIYINRAAFGLAPGSTLEFVVNGAATTTNPTFIYNSGTHLLTFDSNGSAPGGEVAFLELTNGSVLVSSDIVLYG